jgi:DNA repair exonuclease SbcCD ATPase subunit
VKSLSIEEAVRRLAKHEEMEEATFVRLIGKHPGFAHYVIDTAQSVCEPSADEVAEATAYLATLTPADLEHLAHIKGRYWSDALHEHRAADRCGDRPSRKAAEHRHAAEYADGMADDIEEMDLLSGTPLGIVRRARWAKEHRPLRPTQRTPEEQAARAAEWEAIGERCQQELKQAETRAARNKRYRTGLAAADPLKAEVARLRKNLHKAKDGLAKAQQRVAELEAAMRDRTDPTAEVYLPRAQQSVAGIQTTVDRGQVALAAAERAVANTESVSPPLL